MLSRAFRQGVSNFTSVGNSSDDHSSDILLRCVRTYHSCVTRVVTELLEQKSLSANEIFALISWTCFYHRELSGRIGIPATDIWPNMHQRCEERCDVWVLDTQQSLNEWLNNLMLVHTRDMEFCMVDNIASCTWPADLFAALRDCIGKVQKISQSQMLFNTFVVCAEILRTCHSQWKRVIDSYTTGRSAQTTPSFEYIIALGNSFLACMEYVFIYVFLVC